MTIKCAPPREPMTAEPQGRQAAPGQFKAANDNQAEWPLTPFPEGWHAAC